MNPFDVAAVVVSIAALAGYLNLRLFKLPASSGTLLVALLSSVLVAALDAFFPDLRLAASISAFLERIDFNKTLMHGMLSFLLFAGALRVDLNGLARNKIAIGVLSTIGVLLSTGVIGILTWWIFPLLGTPVPLEVCLVLGALVSPTDPVAVLGLLKELHAPESLEAQIAGESLFNDGVGVVVFFALLSLSGLSGGEAPDTSTHPASLILFFLREIVGGAVLGLVFGYLSFRALRSVDDHPLELLITLALAMFVYAASFWIGVSGPIAVVTAGLLIGNPGRRFAMSRRTREHVDAFWNMVDEILNAVLFLLIGFEFLVMSPRLASMLGGVLVIPLALAARWISVALPVAALGLRHHFPRGLVQILTWSGLRGGISVAMVLSLPQFPAKNLLLASTYAVVVFSILVQGLTVRRVLVHFGVGSTESGLTPAT